MLALLVAGHTQAVPHQMHNAGLYGRMREDARNGCGQAFQVVAAEVQDVLQAARLQFGQDLQPALGAFALRQPEAQ